MAPCNEYNLILHYDTCTEVIENVDPDRYGILDLMEKVCDLSLSHVPSNIGLSMSLFCNVPESNEKLIIAKDGDVFKMFEIHKTKYIHIYVETQSSEPPQESNTSGPSNIASTLDLNDMIDTCDYDWDDEFYGFGSEDEEWKANSEDVSNDRLSDEDGLVEEDDSDDNSKGLEDYASGDDAACDSSSEEEIHRSVRQKTTEKLINNVFDQCMYGNEFHVDHNNIITLKQGLVFDNVDVFRKVLKEFSIQEGFQLVRIKNERTRVTCKCSADGCKWRIHASPLPDGISFQIKSYNPEHSSVKLFKNPEANSSYIDPCFSKATYLAAHSCMTHPICDQKMSPAEGDPLQPPPLRRLTGRPRVNRRRAIDEPAAGTSKVRRSLTLKCKRCGEFGHNRRTCQGPPVSNRNRTRGRGRGGGRTGATDGMEMAAGGSRGRGRVVGATMGRGKGRPVAVGSVANDVGAAGRGNTGAAGMGNNAASAAGAESISVADSSNPLMGSQSSIYQPNA